MYILVKLERQAWSTPFLEKKNEKLLLINKTNKNDIIQGIRTSPQLKGAFLIKMLWIYIEKKTTNDPHYYQT